MDMNGQDPYQQQDPQQQPPSPYAQQQSSSYPNDPQPNPQQPDPQQGSQPSTEGKTNTMAILALIFGFLFGILGIIFGIIALSQIKKDPSQKGKGLAIAGIIIGAFGGLFVTLVIIGSFAFFGVLNPNTLVPERCTFSTGMVCSDYRVTPDSITLALENGMGKGIKVISLKATDSVSGSSCEYIGELGIANGMSQSFTINGCSIQKTSSKKAKIEIELLYYFSDSNEVYSHIINGEIYAGFD